MSVFNPGSFQQFQTDLAAALQAARAIGTPEATIKKQAAALGDYLVQQVTPQNPEQQLLKNLWEAASEAEQQAIASALVKMVQKQTPTVH